MAKETSLSMDELLAQSLAMQDYVDFMNTNNNDHTNHNHNTDSTIPPIPSELMSTNSNTPRVPTNTNLSTNTNPNPNKPPQILNQQCLPSILNHYITNKSIVDLSSDLNSVNPDIHNLFIKYNYMYFDNKLSGCEIKWSKRMTLCAGLCCYEGHGGLCSIKLSSPLLKYRSTKEMIETLIHEMIHAYLFVTFNNRDRESHGERFKTLMNVVNYLSNLNISIYHTFHDEVDQYRTHIWKCNGPCQYKPPYFGLVKRAMNRVPGPRDTWWNKHKFECGGQYTKISEPKEFTEKQKRKKEREERKRLREEMKQKGLEMPKVKRPRGRKRKRVDDDEDDKNKNKKNKNKNKKNVRTLLDMFETVKDKDKNKGKTKMKDNHNEPPRKRQKIDTECKDSMKEDDNGSDLELLLEENTNTNTNSNTNNDHRKCKDDVVMNEKNDDCLKVACPICGVLVIEQNINSHLDDCLS